jgi:hypothetical protein
MAEEYRYRKPRKLNWVTILVLIVLVGGGYFAVKYVPVYWQRHKVEEILVDVGMQSADLPDLNDKDLAAEEERLLEEARTRIQALGVGGPDGVDLDVSYDPDYTYISASYSVTVNHVIGKPHVLKFTRKGRVPQAQGSSFD